MFTRRQVVTHGTIGAFAAAAIPASAEAAPAQDNADVVAGMNVFYDIYDWHVKYQQPLQVGRNPENRLTIHFMFTTLIVKTEMDPNYTGVPFDRA